MFADRCFARFRGRVLPSISIFMAVMTGPVSAAGAQVQLVAPAEAPAGSLLPVTWSGGPGERDFITLVEAGTPEGEYSAYKYARRARVELIVPDEPGEYELRYLDGNPPHPTLARQPVRVMPVSATIEAPAAVPAGSPVDIRWTGPDNPRDFITIVPAGTPEKKYKHYVYAAKGNPARLTAPEAAGDYEVRYLTGHTYRTLASAGLTVRGVDATLDAPASVGAGAEFEVGWTGPANERDWVALAEPGAPANKYVHYRYTSSGSPVLLRAPDAPGDYEVRYLTGGEYGILATRPIQVTEITAGIEAPSEVRGGERFTFRWTGPGRRGDYIGMTAEGAPERARYAAHVYAEHGNPGTLRAPLEPGPYELRYETGQSGRILVRVPVKVTPPESSPGTLRVVPADPDRIALPTGDGIEVILDASGSMLQRVSGQRRIDIAKNTLLALVEKTLAPGTPLALRVFGHREKDSCRTDLEIPLQPLDVQAAQAAIGGIQAMNLAKTPIADSLARAAGDLASVRGQRVLVLVTDGEETCGGDPAAAVEALRAGGADVRVNIVGFAIDDEDLKGTFRYWADLGGGGYHDASDAEALRTSLLRALSASYDVVDGGGEPVASGLVGGEPVSVPAGRYTIRTRGTTVIERPVEIRPGEMSVLRLGEAAG